MTLSDSAAEQLQQQQQQQLQQQQQQLQQQRLGFHRLHLSCHQPAIEQQIGSSLLLVKIVADFTDRVAQLYCNVGLQLEEILDEFQEKSDQLSDQHNVQSCSATVQDAWYSLLKEMHEEARSYSRLSGALMKNVHAQLSDLSTHKSAQAARILALRGKLDLLAADSDVACCQQLRDFNDMYANYTCDSRNASRLVSALLNTHNQYVLSLHSANRTKEEFYGVNLPGMLQELEEIQVDAVNVLTGALESHCYLRMSSLDTIRSRYESALSACKGVTPQRDVQGFVRGCLVAADGAGAASGGGGAGPGFELGTYSPACLGESDFVLKDEIVNDRLTEAQLKTKQLELLKERQELQSFIRQNEEVTESLKTFCQRNLGSHLYDKVYETQEDLSRKRNEIRMASIQLAAVQAQMDVMSFNKKQDDAEDDDGSRKDEASIKGLWKRAFNTLKIRDKDKTPKKKKGSSGRDEDDAQADGVDPVYSLLKRAADKGVQKCTGCSTAPGGGGSSSSSPRKSQDAQSLLTGGCRRESTVSALPTSPAINAGSWARRKAMMNAFRMKSISMDETDRAAAAQSEQPQPPGAARAEKPRDLPLASRAQPAPPSSSGRQPGLAQSGRRMLDSRMKSISVDNPDQVAGQVQMLKLDDDARKKSSSFTNTNFIESQVPPSPKRKKQLFGRNKSFSVEQENTGIRRVEFSDEAGGGRLGGLSPRHSPRQSPRQSPRGSPGRGSPGRGSPNSPKSTTVSPPAQTSPRRSPGFATASPETSPTQRGSPGRDKDMSKQIGKRRLQWKMKSFSLDTPDAKHNLEVDEFETAAAAAALSAAAPRGAVGGGGGGGGSGSGYGRSGDPTMPDRGDWGDRERSPGSSYTGYSRDNEELSRYGASGYAEPMFEHPVPPQPQRSRKLLRESRLSGNLYVVLYDFKARHRDEMDLRAGFKLSCIEMADQDWWRGKCMGRIGLFPAAYVQKIRDGDIIWRVVSPLTTGADGGGSTVRLYRGQIVVQQSQRKSPHYVPITLKDGKELGCPLQILERLLD